MKIDGKIKIQVITNEAFKDEIEIDLRNDFLLSGVNVGIRNLVNG